MMPRIAAHVAGPGDRGRNFAVGDALVGVRIPIGCHPTACCYAGNRKAR